MRIRTVVRDCLQLNWALSVGALPEPPPPLRYEVVGHGEQRVAFVSALLYRHEGLRLKGVPGLRLSYPQFHLRLNVLDADGFPAVLVQSVLVPSWVLPAARLLTRQRALPGIFQYPESDALATGMSAVWTVRRRRSLAVSIEVGAVPPAVEPCLGNWQETVRHLRRRSRGYVRTRHGLQRVESTFSDVEVLPVMAVVHRRGLLSESLPLAGEDWPALHSAWLCPEIPYVVEWGGLPDPALPRSAPATG